MAAQQQQLSALAARLAPPLDGSAKDLLLCLYQGLALIALRVATERFAVPRVRAALKRRFAAIGDAAGERDAARRAREVVDNAFLVAIIAPLSVWAWWVMLRHNGPCTPWAPKGCLVGWPEHPVAPQWRLWWLSVGGVYAGEMIGTALGGVGFSLNGEMVLHHVITMALMVRGGRHWGGGGRGGAQTEGQEERGVGSSRDGRDERQRG